jgi:hypothetical protein
MCKGEVIFSLSLLQQHYLYQIFRRFFNSAEKFRTRSKKTDEAFPGGGYLRPAHTIDKDAMLVVPNVAGMMEAQLSISPLSLRDLLRESFTLTFTAVLIKIQVWDVTPFRLANVYQSKL